MTMQLVRVVSVLLLVNMAMSLDSNASNVTEMETPEQMRLREVQDAYEQDLAVNSRLNNHFFCINRSTEEVGGELDITFTEFEQDPDRVWTLFFQFPALAYLDPQRKIALLQIVLSIVNPSGDGQTPNTANPPSNLEDLCIGTFEFYELTTFRESVLFHLYAREPAPPFTASVISQQFEANVRSAFMDPNNDLVVQYPEQPDVIAFNLTAMMMLQQDEILLPFRETQDGADPTTLAVYLGTFGSNMTLAQLQEADAVDDDMFAENPNPVNYGLEAGDIVFAVFGSILLALLTFVIFLGYCIHPFWLA